MHIAARCNVCFYPELPFSSQLMYVTLRPLKGHPKEEIIYSPSEMKTLAASQLQGPTEQLILCAWLMFTVFLFW